MQHDGLYRVLSGQNEYIICNEDYKYSNGLLRKSTIIQPNLGILAVLATVTVATEWKGSHCCVVGLWQ